MRGWHVWTVGIVWMTFVPLGAVAFAGQSMSREERIQATARRVERAAGPLGEAETDERSAAIFRVKPRTVTDLHDQKLDLGEVAVVLALAEAGHTSPDTILSLWASGRLNWGDIAERLKVDLRDLLRRVETVRRELGRRGR